MSMAHKKSRFLQSDLIGTQFKTSLFLQNSFGNQSVAVIE